MVAFARWAGLVLVHLPNKGGGAAITNDLVTGDTHVALLNAASSMGVVKAGQVRALAVMSDQRVPEYADVPTLMELGYPNAKGLWSALYAPAATPRDVLEIVRDAAVTFPAILNLGPYQKDKLWIPPSNLEEEPNPLMNWETVNPQWWVPKGYAAVRVDGRGSGKSPGQCEPWSLAESVDFCDAIEWAAAQPWCNGKIGLSGISYFAINQWFVANLQPPSLKAIIPWEGFADIYRDALFHGGILSVFMTNWFTAHLMHHVMGRAAQHQPDGWQTNTLWNWMHSNLDSGALRGAQAQWDKITVPMLTVGNWTGFALHLRGN